MADDIVETVEGTPLAFAVCLSEIAQQDTKISYTISEGTATEGEDYDYDGMTSTTIAAGSRYAIVELKTILDEDDESDETVIFSLTGVGNSAGAGGEVAVGVIKDKELAEDSHPLVDSAPADSHPQPLASYTSTDSHPLASPVMVDCPAVTTDTGSPSPEQATATPSSPTDSAGLNILFYLIMALILYAAIRVISSASISKAALHLMLVGIGIAALLLFLGAEYAGMTQALVYLGAIIYAVAVAALLFFNTVIARVPPKSYARIKNSKRALAAAVAALTGMAVVYGFWRYFGDKEFSAMSDTADSVVSTLLSSYVAVIQLVVLPALVVLVGALASVKKKGTGKLGV